MRTRHRSLGMYALAAVFAFGLWALPAQAGGCHHYGRCTASCGYRGHATYYRRGHFRPAPYYVYHRSYRYPQGWTYYPPRSQYRGSYYHRGRGYGHYRRGYRSCRW